VGMTTEMWLAVVAWAIVAIAALWLVVRGLR
jgi:hypothetical protein